MMAPAPQPYLFAPVFKEKIWGGQALASRLGKAIDPRAAIGESWEISGFDNDLTRVISPAAHGATIPELLRDFGGNLLGERLCADSFPLLYKYIDANDKLSVQVHPNDSQAQANGWGRYGKTESWYVVDAQPGAQLIMGFKKGVRIDDVRRGIEDSTLEALLNYIDVRAGDVLYIPAGTVHAILAGVLLYEVQQSSDTTLRLYDWGRLDAGGKPRRLHVGESLEVLDTAYHEQHKIPPVVCDDYAPCNHTYRVACDYFALEEFSFVKAHAIELAPRRSFRAAAFLDGEGELSWPGGRMQVKRGDSVLVPANVHALRLDASSGTKMLVSWVPDLRAEIIGPLRSEGVGEKDIEGLGGYTPKNALVTLM